jgi:serine/threonine protein kinase
LQKCVDKDPARRWSCEQLLRHPYFDNFHFKIPDSELEEFEKLRKLRDRSRVSRKKWLLEVPSDVLLVYFKRGTTCLHFSPSQGDGNPCGTLLPFKQQFKNTFYGPKPHVSTHLPLFKILSSVFQILIDQLPQNWILMAIFGCQSTGVHF